MAIAWPLDEASTVANCETTILFVPTRCSIEYIKV